MFWGVSFSSAPPRMHTFAGPLVGTARPRETARARGRPKTRRCPMQHVNCALFRTHFRRFLQDFAVGKVRAPSVFRGNQSSTSRTRVSVIPRFPSPNPVKRSAPLSTSAPPRMHTFGGRTRGDSLAFLQDFAVGKGRHFLRPPPPKCTLL